MKPLAVGAFDIDGTLCHHDGKPDYLNPATLYLGKPDPHICKRVGRLIDGGVEVHFITGRSHEVRTTTLEWLQDHVHRGIVGGQLHTNKEWSGYDDLAVFKAAKLRAVGAQWFVGDHEADAKAAKEAGIPFQFAYVYSDTCKAVA